MSKRKIGLVFFHLLVGQNIIVNGQYSSVYANVWKFSRDQQTNNLPA